MNIHVLFNFWLRFSDDVCHFSAKFESSVLCGTPASIFGHLFPVFWSEGAHESDFGSLFEQNGLPKARGAFLSGDPVPSLLGLLPP